MTQRRGILPSVPLASQSQQYPTAYVPDGYQPPPAGILCPELYNRLQSRFPGGVLVANEGDPMLGFKSMEVRQAQQIDRWKVSYWGETYRINCPFCHDTRHRLWINHRYGQPDPAYPNQRGSFYGICFNEGCLEDHDNREELYDRIFQFINRNERDSVPQVLHAAVPDTRLIAREPPGHVEPLTRVPYLPGLDWMVGVRRFDPATLDRYEVQLCLEVFKEEWRLAYHRIIFPIRMHGMYVGWQARYVGDPPSKRIPKYFTLPGLPVRQILYNYDRAKLSPFVVVFEGITDVMRFGDCSVAMLGKRLKHEQGVLLGSTFMKREPIIFCLDPDAADESALAMHQLAQNVENPVIRVQLPAGYDPADYDRPTLHAIIRSQARDRGIDLPTV